MTSAHHSDASLRWPEVLASIAGIVGEAHVRTDATLLSEVSTTTFHTEPRALAVVSPKNRDEVVEVLRVAHAARGAFAVYPVSSGRNWGYGSAVPTRDAIVLHLGRMDRITDFDDELGTVTIEPGVTQRGLAAFLEERGARFWLDVTSSSPDCSVIGNLLERGVGFTPYADHAAHACAFEVVLASSEVVRTGMSRFGDGPAAGAHRWGVGPSLDGLFAQSNFGIVTRVTQWLTPKPEHYVACFANVESDEELEHLLDALRRLRAAGTIRGAPRINDATYVLTSVDGYPHADLADGAPLPGPVRARLRKKWDLGAWHVTLGLYGSRRETAAAKKELRRHLGAGIRALRFLDDRWYARARWLAKPYGWLTGVPAEALVEKTRPAFGVMRGQPTDAALRSLYWRKRGDAPPVANPDRDRCGFMWCAPVVPAKNRCVREVVDLARATLGRHGFEALVGLNLVTERAIYANIGLAYDRYVSGHDQAAREAHDELFDALAGRGYYPHRLGLQSMGRLPASNDAQLGLQTLLKRTLDPHGILAPGRYDG